MTKKMMEAKVAGVENAVVENAVVENAAEVVVQKLDPKEVLKATNNKDYRTADGYFKDPFTGAELTGEEERVPTDFKTPRIYASDGVTLIPIAYKFWTKEERAKFEANKGTGAKRTSSVKVNEEEINNQIKVLNEIYEVCKSQITDKESLEKISNLLTKVMPKSVEEQKAEKQKAALEAKIAKMQEELAKLSA